jgi:hypothetical protein
MTTVEGAVQLHEVRTMKESFLAIVLSFNPDAVLVFDAPELWTELDEFARLVTAAATLLARRVDESCTWRREGFRSAAEQLAARSGTTVAAAKAMLETSERVAAQPTTERALRSGELSARKAELVSSAVEVAPDAAAGLLELAASAPVAKVRQALCA